jgi:hypothetical protein
MGNPNAPIRFSVQSIRDSCRRDMFHGKEMLKVRQSQRNLICEAWIQSSAPFSIARLVLSREGRTLWEAHVQHDVRGNPKSWTMQQWSKNGELEESYNATVTKCVINPKIPADRFTIDFPPRTGFYDERSNKQFVVKANTDRREVLRSELRADYEMLLNTETGKAITQVGNRRSWTAIAFTLLLIGVLTCMLVRKRTMSLHPAPDLT